MSNFLVGALRGIVMRGPGLTATKAFYPTFPKWPAA